MNLPAEEELRVFVPCCGTVVADDNDEEANEEDEDVVNTGDLLPVMCANGCTLPLLEILLLLGTSPCCDLNVITSSSKPTII